MNTYPELGNIRWCIFRLTVSNLIFVECLDAPWSCWRYRPYAQLWSSQRNVFCWLEEATRKGLQSSPQPCTSRRVVGMECASFRLWSIWKIRKNMKQNSWTETVFLEFCYPPSLAGAAHKGVASKHKVRWIKKHMAGFVNTTKHNWNRKTKFSYLYCNTFCRCKKRDFRSKGHFLLTMNRFA